MNINQSKLKRQSSMLLLINLIVILVMLGCDAFVNDDNFEYSGDETGFANINFYYEDKIILSKFIEIGSVVGNIEIPDIDLEKYSINWSIYSYPAGIYVDLDQYVVQNEYSLNFYAYLEPNYLDIIIEYNNGEPPTHTTIYTTSFYHSNPKFSNYEVVPGRFIDLVFDGWYVDGEQIYANSSSSVLKEDCTIHAGWKLPVTSGSTSWESMSITIPKFITSLDDSVFKNWKELKEVIIEEQSMLKSIGASAFANTSKLKSISIPDSVIEIKDSAFLESGIELCEISSSSKLRSIGRQAFFKTKIKEINLPNTLETIGEEAFCATFWLSSVTIDDENSKLTSIGKYAFSDSDISSFTIPIQVYQIGGGAFSACRSLTEISVNPLNPYFTTTEGIVCKGNTLVAWPDGKTPRVIPEGISVISDYTFGFSLLETITLPSTLEKIGTGAFEQSGLLSIAIPDSVIEIADFAFYVAYDLEVCDIGPESKLSHIGTKAFNSTKITDFTMSPSIKIVGADAFTSRWLTNIGFHEGIKTIGDYFGKVPAGTVIIPDSVTAIVSNAFASNSKLFTNKTSIEELSEYGLSSNQIARYTWFNKTTNKKLE